MNITVTTEHLDKALAVPWTSCNCLIAQAIRNCVELDYYTGGLYNYGNYKEFRVPAVFRQLMRKFDRAHAPSLSSFSNIRNALVDEIRASLPVTATLEFD